MFSELIRELPQNDIHVNVDVAEDNAINNNVGVTDTVTDNSAVQRNICCRSSPD